MSPRSVPKARFGVRKAWEVEGETQRRDEDIDLGDRMDMSLAEKRLI